MKKPRALAAVLTAALAASAVAPALADGSGEHATTSSLQCRSGRASVPSSSTTTTKSGKSARKSKKSRAGKMPTATGSTTSTATIRPTNSSSSGTYRRTIRVLGRVPHNRDAEPFERDWLGVFFGRSNIRRFAIAFAAAIALHEIAAGVIPRNPASAPPQREIVTRAQILRVVRRVAVKPIPRPLPTTALSPAWSPQPHRARVLAKSVEGRAGARGAAARTKAPAQRYGAKPVWDVGAGSGTGQLAGAQTGSATGSGSGSRNHGGR